MSAPFVTTGYKILYERVQYLLFRAPSLADSNCSVTLFETSPTDRRYALRGSVTCLSDFNRLVWKAEDESVGKCADDSGMPAACYEESDGGLELKIFSQEKKGLKKFKCIGRCVANEEPGSFKSRVCTVKVSWT